MGLLCVLCWLGLHAWERYPTLNDVWAFDKLYYCRRCKKQRRFWLF